MTFAALAAFARAHRIALGVSGGVVAAGAVVALVKRRRAAEVGGRLVEKLMSVLGTPYVWGSRDPATGLDCSGAVVWALRELGLQPKKWNSTAAGMKKDSSVVIVPQPGDLAFYGSLFGVSHVMVYAGDGKVVGASGGGPGTTLAEARAKGAGVKVLPVDYRSDFRGYGRLPVQEAKDAAVGALDMVGSG